MWGKNNQTKKVDSRELQQVTGCDYNLDLAILSGNKQNEIAQRIKNSGLCPDSFKTTSEIVLGMHTAMALGFRHFGHVYWAMCRMMIVKNQISLWGDLPMALAQHTKEVEHFEEFFVDGDGEKICYTNKNLKNLPYAAICIMKRKGGVKTEFVVTMDDLKIAGGEYKNGRWEFKYKYKDKHGNWKEGLKDPWFKYPKRMWLRKAKNLAVSSQFPDVLFGLAGVSFSDSDFKKHNTIKDIEPDMIEPQDTDSVEAEVSKTEQQANEDFNNEKEG